MGYCGYTMFNALVNIEHLINKKARPAELGGLVRVGLLPGKHHQHRHCQPACPALVAISQPTASRPGCRRDLSLMANKGWMKRFDEPIVLDDGLN
jgi:hypothetical protein